MWIVFNKENFNIVGRHDLKVLALADLDRYADKPNYAGFGITRIGAWWHIINENSANPIGVFETKDDARSQLEYMVTRPPRKNRYDICEMTFKTEDEWLTWKLLNKKN